MKLPEYCELYWILCLKFKSTQKVDILGFNSFKLCVIADYFTEITLLRVSSSLERKKLNYY